MSSDSAKTAKLMIRLEQGDDNALAELFAMHRERLRQMVRFRLDRRLRGRVDASDVLQEAYLDAAKRLPHFFDKPQMSFFVWLRQVTTQRLVDIHRRHLGAQRRDARQEVPIHRSDYSAATSASMAARLVGHLTSPSQIVMRLEMLEHLEQALGGMDPIDREVLALRHFEDLTNNEVAEVLQISKAAASNRYVRALSRLHAIMQNVPGFFDEQES